MKLFYVFSFAVVAVAAIFMLMRKVKPVKILFFIGVAAVSVVFVGMSFITPNGTHISDDTYGLFDSLAPFGNIKAAEKILALENLEYPEGAVSVYSYLFVPLKHIFLRIFPLDFAFAVIFSAFLPSLIKRNNFVRVVSVLIPFGLVFLKTALYMNHSVYALNLFDTFELVIVLVGSFVGLAADHFVFGMSKKEQL